MGRRRKSSGGSLIDDLIAASRINPWVGLFLGVVVWGGAVYLIWVNPGAILGGGSIFGLSAGLLGTICLWLAGANVVRTRTAPERAGRPLAGAWSIEAVRGLTWLEFEGLVADLFRRQGYTVEERGRDAKSAGTGDGGVDLVLSSSKTPGAHYLVQCKQYLAWDVGEPKVREFYGAMAAFRTNCEGIVVTCGRFTQPAKNFAAGKPLQLIDGQGLVCLLNQSNGNAPSVTIAVPKEVHAVSVSAALPTAEIAPPCPKCGRSMVRRIAERGERKGRAFWGCPSYPQCRGVINIGG